MPADNRVSPADNLIAVASAEVEWHVASLVVHCQPDSLAANKHWLLSQPGVEIHAENSQGKLIVVMESHRAQDILDLIDTSQEQPGIVNAALVYHEIVAPEEEDNP